MITMDIKKVLNNVRIKNGIWLYALQFFQLVVPLLTFPYLTRVLGAEKYGVFSIALNVVNYLQVLEEYGFNYSGTRKMALSSKQNYSKVYSNIFSSKIFLSCITGVVLIVILLLSIYPPELKKCMLILFGIVIGATLQQTWVFQGFQVMKYITIINVVSRTISVILIFMFVKSKDDIFLYCVLFTSTNLLSGIASVYLCKKKFALEFHFSKFKDIIKELRDGFSLFLTSAMSIMVSTLGVFLLGIYAAAYDVGIYTAMQKIPNVLITCFTPISQVLFPYISTLFQNNRIKAKKILKIMYGPVMFVIGGMCIVLGFMSEFIVEILCGKEYISGVAYAPVLLAWVFLSIFNNFLGTQTLVASGRSKQYSQIFVVSAITSVICNVCFIKILYCKGAAWATFISEVVLTILLTTYIVKNRMAIFSQLRNTDNPQMI